jgi:hypothetical protein
LDAAVLSTIGTPNSRAARATASSASGWTIDITPTGPSITGAGMPVPSTLVARSRVVTSVSIRGTIRQRSKAARLAPTVVSSPAPPAT